MDETRQQRYWIKIKKSRKRIERKKADTTENSEYGLLIMKVERRKSGK